MLSADDARMSLAWNNPNARADTLNSDLEEIVTGQINGVKFNGEKTELLNCIRDQNTDIPLKFEDITLQDTANATILKLYYKITANGINIIILFQIR